MLVAVAYACLTMSFVGNDFSVLYVAQNSNSELPTFYRFAAVWGAHEGSLLLWLLVQATWTLGVVAFSGNMPQQMTSRVVGVLGLISAGFALFIWWRLVKDDYRRGLEDALDERELMSGFQKIANRITTGLVLAALIIGAAMLMRVETSFRILGYPGFAILLFVGAVIGGLLLVWDIVQHDRRPKPPR